MRVRDAAACPSCRSHTAPPPGVFRQGGEGRVREGEDARAGMHEQGECPRGGALAGCLALAVCIMLHVRQPLRNVMPARRLRSHPRAPKFIPPSAACPWTSFSPCLVVCPCPPPPFPPTCTDSSPSYPASAMSEVYTVTRNSAGGRDEEISALGRSAFRRLPAEQRGSQQQHAHTIAGGASSLVQPAFPICFSPFRP